MPELPEVETVRVQLFAKLKGETIEGIEVRHPKVVGFDRGFKKCLISKRFKDIDRIGKLLIFSFVSEPDLYLLAHLKMTGQFFVTDKKGQVVGGGGHSMNAALGPLPDKHTRVIFGLSGGHTLFFNDQRIFGYLKLVNKAGMEAAKAGFGQEPINNDFDHQAFFVRIQRSDRVIKALLLDQSVVAGLGNIYVDEALFRSDIRPDRCASSLTKAEARLLAKNAGQIMNESIKHGGTTFRSFTDADGGKGGFVKHLRVFDRQGQPCLTCQTPITKTKLAGRGTHFCEHCQK